MTEVPTDTSGVRRIGRRIYFFADINDSTALALMGHLADIEKEDSADVTTYAGINDRPILLYIHSGGGLVFSSFSLMDIVQASVSPIWSIVTGYAASGATLLSMACRKRYIMPTAYMMIHQPRGLMWGTHQETMGQASMMEKNMKAIVDFYTSRSKLSREKIEAYLMGEAWFTAPECVEAGLADEIWRMM